MLKEDAFYDVKAVGGGKKRYIERKGMLSCGHIPHKTSTDKELHYSQYQNEYNIIMHCVRIVFHLGLAYMHMHVKLVGCTYVHILLSVPSTFEGPYVCTASTKLLLCENLPLLCYVKAPKEGVRSLCKCAYTCA
ncbi:hypothetical protein POVWA2_030320 [Plasmodium ovale wallikeri]|uniref:Uncharacterized protein n=1 Tax=Plasmodium ovale wallikeri TaxID=864142 RepID=A0A1A8YYB3_PLAOA|nr:hypothetical protein POVWA1_030730 [Plasmodium ovale wallikeri]SBT36453.1 hypothetical protein POVWA2_030320 [Plasmodium ovale wallikeri]